MVLGSVYNPKARRAASEPRPPWAFRVYWPGFKYCNGVDTCQRMRGGRGGGGWQNVVPALPLYKTGAGYPLGGNTGITAWV